MLKKILIVAIILLFAGILFMPEITSFSAKKAFLEENRKEKWAPKTAYNAAFVNMRFWRYGAAEKMLIKSMKLFPNYEKFAEASYRLAVCLEKNGKPKDAIAQFQVFKNRNT